MRHLDSTNHAISLSLSLSIDFSLIVVIYFTILQLILQMLRCGLCILKYVHYLLFFYTQISLLRSKPNKMKRKTSISNQKLKLNEIIEVDLICVNTSIRASRSTASERQKESADAVDGEDSPLQSKRSSMCFFN